MQTLMHSVDDEDNEDLAYIYGLVFREIWMKILIGFQARLSGEIG